MVFIFRQIIKFYALFCLYKILITIKTKYVFQVHSFLPENGFFFECVFKKSLQLQLCSQDPFSLNVQQYVCLGCRDQAVYKTYSIPRALSGELQQVHALS